MDDLKNQTVIILGNGPSINDLDFDIVSRFKTIGVNVIQKIYDPDYLVILDLVTAIRGQEMFKNGNATIYYPVEDNFPVQGIKFPRWRPSLGLDIFTASMDQGVFWGHSSVLAAINLAYIHGAEKIILAGVDLHDQSHFYSDDGQDKGFLNLEYTIQDFNKVAEFMNNKGVPVYNLNRDSLLKCFKYISLNNL